MEFHLKANLNLPLEREHEAWTIRGIEDYAKSLRLRLKVCAVSPKEEKTWPGDEVLTFRSKLFGLQFKRPYPSGSESRWRIDSASQQHAAVCATPAIFYALPSYTNRALRLAALHHCLFWRPCRFCTRVQYVCLRGVSQSRSELERCCCNNPMRWGDFVEALYRCELIDPVETGGTFGASAEPVLSMFQQAAASKDEDEPAASKDEHLETNRDEFRKNGQTDALYLFALEVRI